MTHFDESVLIDTTDGFQCKTYASEHPEGYIIVKPKYIPRDAIKGDGLKYRFLFGKCLTRFNLFAKKEKVIDYVNQLREKYPDYIYDSPIHKNWFFVVPRNKIKKIHDPKAGLQELLKVPESNLDDYLTLVVKLIKLLEQSGVRSSDIGITHSTLLGNYTYGKSDIDIIIFGRENGWKILNFLNTAKHELLRWKSDAEWREYYQEHKTSESSHFTEEEYAKHMERKRYEGTFGGTVFTLFTSEKPDETWFKWGEETYEPMGLVTVDGEVVSHEYSIVRPGYYEIKDSKIIDGDHDVPVSRVVSYSIPFLYQALKGEKLRACGLLEKVTPKEGDVYYRIVVGYFDAYVTDRREKEYVKSLG